MAEEVVEQQEEKKRGVRITSKAPAFVKLDASLYQDVHDLAHFTWRQEMGTTPPKDQVQFVDWFAREIADSNLVDRYSDARNGIIAEKRIAHFHLLWGGLQHHADYSAERVWEMALDKFPLHADEDDPGCPVKENTEESTEE
jgi:hypothetical protein